MARISQATKVVVEQKAAAGCFMCKWALEGMEKQGSAWALRDFAKKWDVSYPATAQEYHIRQELKP